LCYRKEVVLSAIEQSNSLSIELDVICNTDYSPGSGVKYG
jgi:hypothetical protein